MIVQLTSLLGNSTPFLLAYSVPLLLFSALVTFSGTFLTLDRTRTFAPRSDATPPFPGTFEKNRKPKTWTLRLDGGVGGLLIGYVFGLHASTFLSLLIMNEASSSSLTPTTFLLTWLFSVISPVILGGRWRMATLVFLGMSGGITLSIALSIITHPSLTSRVILASVITPLTTLIVVVPSIFQWNLAHSTARTASSCLGAFSMTMAVALLTRSTLSYSWANAWDRLWVSNGLGWGTSRERGFDALFCVLWAGGALTDWALKRWIGEDPDEKWDAYLAEYSSTLPNAHDRAGSFVPLRSWWTRILCRLHLTSSSPARPHEVLFPGDVDFSRKADYASIPGIAPDEKPAAHLSREDLQRSVSPAAYNWDPPHLVKGAGILRKGKTRNDCSFKRILENDASNAESESKIFDLTHRPTYLQKAKSMKANQRRRRLAEKRRRVPVEFRPKEGFSSESDAEDLSDDDELKTPFGTLQKDTYTRASPGPLVRMGSSATALSGTTVHPSSSSGHGLDNADVVGVMDIHSEKARIMNMKATFGGISRAAGPTRTAPDYSDVEEDVTAVYARSSVQPHYGAPGWKPEFLKRASPSDSSKATAHESSAAKNTPSPPAVAVPMTPSLVHALGRLAKAQADAYGPSLEKDVSSKSRAPHHDSPATRREHISIAMDAPGHIAGLPVMGDEQQIAGGNKEKWVSFWNEIQVKAAET